MKSDDILKAVGIKYLFKKGMIPDLRIKATSEEARRLIQWARKNNIPIHEDPLLVQVLISLDLSGSIPESLYSALIEVFFWIIEMEYEHE
jgi:flagellar biosynthesis protein